MLDSDKQRAFARASTLLAGGDDLQLSYAALELRFILESITYAKLRTYAKRIPDEVLATWQPPQAMRALLEFEPLADHGFAVRIAREEPDGRPVGQWQLIGEHKTLRLAQLRKLYNKLGSYLHLPAPQRDERHAGDRKAEAATIRKDLESIVESLEPVVARDFDGTLAEVFYFTCERCGQQVIRNARSARTTQCAVCLNPSCRAEYHLAISDADDVDATLMVTAFDCANCAGSIPVENRLLEIGLTFRCPRCATQHQIVSREWGCVPIDSSNWSAADDA